MPSQSTCTILYEAAVYDTDYKPLVENETAEEQIDSMNEEQFNSFKTSSGALGLIFGIFIQLCTLRFNYMIIVLFSIDNLSQHIIMVSLAWCAVTSGVALAVMDAIIRSLVIDPFTGNEASLEKLILYMEYRFVSGVLIGVCMAWTVTNMSLGEKEQECWQALLLLAGALSVCRIMMHCVSVPANEQESRKTIHSEVPMTV